MMALNARHILMVLTAGLVVLAVTGCASQFTESHAEAKAKATQRWQRVRSALILQMAQQQFDTGDLKEAEKSLANAKAIDPEFAQLHVLSGRIALERGKLERSYQHLNMAIELEEEAAPAYFYQGLVLQRWRRFEKALERYEKALELEADNAGYLMAVGEMMVALDRPDDALQLFLDKVEYFDQNAGLRMAIGQIYFMKRDFNEALNYIHRATLLRPQEVAFIEDLALAQLAAGKPIEAVGTYEQLLKLKENRDRRDLKLALGNAYVAADRLGDAKELFIKLTRLDRNDAEAWIKVAETSWALGDTTGALLAAQRFASLNPNQPEGFLIAGLVYERRGRTSDALRMFDRAAQLDPTNATPVIMRGVVLEKAGRKSAAARAYHDALKRKPDDQRARHLLAGVSK